MNLAKTRTYDERKLEEDVARVVKELVQFCMEHDEAVADLGALLLRLGGLPRNFRYAKERRP